VKVGDLVRLRVNGSYGIITARCNRHVLNTNTECKYTVLWNPPIRYKNRRSSGRIWYENELEVISELVV